MNEEINTAFSTKLHEQHLQLSEATKPNINLVLPQPASHKYAEYSVPLCVG